MTPPPTMIAWSRGCCVTWRQPVVGRLGRSITCRGQRDVVHVTSQLEMKAQSGLTLIELMVTLAVAIVLMVVGVPLYQNMQANSRVTGQTNALVTAFTLARSEALARGIPVTVCAKADPAANDTACGDASDWGNGWQVFTDNGANVGSYTSSGDENEKLLRTFASATGTPVLTASVGAVRFLATGELDAATAATLRVAQSSYATSASCLTLNVVGQLSSEKVATGDSCN